MCEQLGVDTADVDIMMGTFTKVWGGKMKVFCIMHAWFRVKLRVDTAGARHDGHVHQGESCLLLSACLYSASCPARGV